MRKPRVLFLSGAVLASIFSFLIFFGAGALNLIPFIRDLMMFSQEGSDTVHFGFDMFAYILLCLKNAKTMIFEPGVLEFYVFPFFLVLLGGAIALIHTVVSCIKLRFEMLVHLIPMGLIAITLPFFAYLFFGIPFNTGDALHTYFLMVIIKNTLPILPKVIFIVLFVNWVLIHLFMLGFFIFVLLAPRKSKKWKALQYEKEFASIREVRTISVEEMKKYISEHKAEVRQLLGIDKPAQAEAVAAAPVAPAKAEPVKAQPVKAEPVKAEPVKAQPVKAEPVKAEPIKAEPVKAENPVSKEDISLEIAKAVAANLNPKENTTTTVIVETSKGKQEIITENKPAPAPAKVEEKKEPVKKAPVAVPKAETKPTTKTPSVKKEVK